jgi:hypothetical protein
VFVTAATPDAEQMPLKPGLIATPLREFSAESNAMSPLSLLFALVALMVTWCSAILLVG